MSNDTELQYCNWTFWDCLKQSNKWLVGRDCQGGREDDEMITLTRGDSRNWRAYKASLQPKTQTRFPQPLPGAQCPNCGRQINGVNPYDDGVNAITPNYEVQFHEDEQFVEFANQVAHLLKKYHTQIGGTTNPTCIEVKCE